MKQVSIRAVTNFLKANGLDPAKLKGANRLYGSNGGPVRLTREHITRIRSILSEGKPVLIRPVTTGTKQFEIMNPENVEFKGTKGRPSRAVVSVEHVNPFRDQRAQRMGKVLLDIRTTAGVPSQSQMAERLGFTQTQYSRYERGSVIPRPKQLAKIARFVEDNEQLHQFKEPLLESTRAN